MDNYSYASSAASSPRSRDLDDENPNPSSASKLKFLVSYNGQILPRHHDPNRLSYVGGDTKIISVDRHVTFNNFSAKLASISGNGIAIGNGISIKYQLPGEDLDGLISVTNEEDLVNLMAEYERVPRPGRLRLFLFPAVKAGLEGGERWFVDALSGVKEGMINSGANPDFLFGLDNSNAEVAAKEECHVIRENGGPRPYAGDYYQQGVPVTVSQQYWQERQVATGGRPEQTVYMIQTPSGVYQSATLRQMTGQLPGQCYYGMQPIYNPVPQPLIQQGVFRGQAVEQGYAAYDVASRQQGMVQGQAAYDMAGRQQAMVQGQAAYDMAGRQQAMVQGQAAYDMAGRQVYYSTGVPAQGVMPQYQAVAVAATAAQDSGNVVVSKAL